MKLRAFSYLLPALVAACGVASEDTSTSANDVTVTPEGPGGDITITIDVPADVSSKPVWQWFTDGDPTSKHLRYFYGNTELTPGVATRVRHQPDGEGFSWITITYGDGDIAERQLSYSDRFWINQGETKTLTLGAVQVHGWLPDVPAIQLTSYAPVEGLSTVWGGQLWAKWRPRTSKANGWWWAMKGGPILPVFAGSYEWSRGIAEPVPFTVTEGQVTSKDVSVADPFTWVQVSVTEEKAFANAYAPSFTVGCRANDGSWRTAALDPSQLRVNLYATEHTDCSWTAGGDSVGTFTLEPKQSITLKTARLDVDDVRLTDEPKGTTVPGEYWVQQNWQGSRREVSGKWLPTKTGLDLPPGSYHLWIRYSSPQGHPQEIERDVDVQ